MAGTTTSSPADPSAITSATDVMAGLGTTFVPTSSKVEIAIQGDLGVSNAGNSITAQARYGTGSAPANGDAVSGTTVGTKIVALPTSTTQRLPFSITVEISGLTPGTTYWFDLAMSRTGGNATLKNTHIVVESRRSS